MHDYNNGQNEVSGCEHNITDLFIKAFKEGGMWNKSEFTNLTLTPKCRYVGWLDISVIKIPLGIALDWHGSSKVFSVDSIFPPPAFDTGWRDLMFRDEVAGNKVFKQRV